MIDRIEPQVVARIWQQAADKVGSLRRDDAGDSTGTWNEAVDEAEALLRKEAGDVLFTARMAQMLITGNVHPDSPKGTVANSG